MKLPSHVIIEGEKFFDFEKFKIGILDIAENGETKTLIGVCYSKDREENFAEIYYYGKYFKE